MPRRSSKPMPGPPVTMACCFCGFSEDNEEELGKLWNHEGIVTHYYCLLLSSNMEQNGKDDEGILGFMPVDIQKELRRGKKLCCTYCKKTGATLGCCNKKCKRVFHLPCGLRAGSLHHFFGEYRSYCVTHRIKQTIDEHIKEEAAAVGTVTCYICYEEVNPQNTIRTLWAPCCRKNAWFHRKCVQRLAISAGYFFKCPLCNNKQEFQQAMLEHGIFIPNQDASWELVPNAYQELLHRHNRCDAVECLCLKGRSYTRVNAKWELVLCRLCGSQGIHKACGHLKLTSSIWECTECVRMLRKSGNTAPHRTIRIRGATKNVPVDDSNSDSDISVGRNNSPLLLLEHPDSMPPTASPINLRPGPRSFKIQQAVQNAKSMEYTKNGTSNISVSGTCDIPLQNSSDTIGNVHSDKKSNGESLQVENSQTKRSSLSMKSASMETDNTISEGSNAFIETIHVKLVEHKRRVAEVILIDSDDEIEIITVKSKQNMLTTNDGSKIPIHSLSQVPAESQEAERDPKVPKFAQSEFFKSSPFQSTSNPVSSNSISMDTFSYPDTYSPISASTETPQILSSNFPKSSVPWKNEIDIAAGDATENREIPDFFIVGEIPEKNSVMNLKITDVTSLHQDCSKKLYQPNVIRKLDFADNICAEDDRSYSPLNGDQQTSVTQIMNPINGTPKSRTKIFQLGSLALKNSSAKRKSEKYTDENLSNCPNEAAMENNKRLRSCEVNCSGSVQKNTSIPWNINVNHVDKSIPILEPTIPSSGTINMKRFAQSTATSQTKPNELDVDMNDDITVIYNSDIQNKNGFHKSPWGSSLTHSLPKKTNHNMNRVHLPYIGQSAIEVTKTYGSVQPEKRFNRLSSKNITPNDTIIHSTTHDHQRIPVNDSRNLQISSGPSKLKSAVQQDINSSKSIALSPHSVHQSHENGSTKIPRYSADCRSLQRNLSTANVVNYDGSPRYGTGSKETINDMSKTNESITQLTNGIPNTSCCDGDAGSSPAAAAAFAQPTTSRSPICAPTKSNILTNTDTTADSKQRTGNNSRISTCVLANPTYMQCHSSPTTTRIYYDKSRIMPNNVLLRDLEFRILDSKMVQIVAYDTLMLNVIANTGNLQDAVEAEHLSGLIREKKPFTSFTRKSKLSTFDAIRTDVNTDISKEHVWPETQYSSVITDTPKKFASLAESQHNSLLLKPKFNNGDLSSTASTMIDNEMRTYCIMNKRYNVGSHISDNPRNQASLTDSPYMKYKENLSKEMVYSTYSNNTRNPKSLHQRDNNIILVDKRKGFSESGKTNFSECN